jgi:ABC-type multidrug transport system fused ATPase/permease subunit
MNLLKRAMALLDPGVRSRWVILVLIAVAVSVVEALSAILLFSLLSMVVGTAQVLRLPVLGTLFPNLARDQLIVVLSGVLAVIFLIRGGLYLLQSFFQNRTAHAAGAQLSNRMVRGYLSMPYQFHLQRNSAELIRNSYNATYELVAQGFIPAVNMVSESFLVLGIMTVLLIKAPLVTLLIAVAITPVIFLLLRIAQPRLAALGRENQATVRENLALLHQSLQGIREIKLLGRETFFAGRYSDSRSRLGDNVARRQVLLEVPRVIIETSVILIVLGLLAIAVQGGGRLQDTVVLLGLFGYAVLRLLPSINRILANANNLRFSAAAINDLHADLHMFETSGSTASAEGPPPLPLEHAISLQNVSFSFEGSARDVLRGIELQVAKGEWLGVVGPTGSGKSTLVDIMMGLLPPTEGKVTVDGTDISLALGPWHAAIAFVPQAQFLLDASLRVNVAFGVPEDEIDEAKVLDCIGWAQLTDVLTTMPEGLDTVVGERGVRLAGGQRQRVAIARALYRDSAALFFDEATSALDNATERDLMKELEAIRGGRTLVTVAHRLSTVKRCDRVIVLVDGRIVDSGTYEDLAAHSAQFRMMLPTA